MSYMYSIRVWLANGSPCILKELRCEDSLCREREDLEDHPYQHDHQQGEGVSNKAQLFLVPLVSDSCSSLDAAKQLEIRFFKHIQK